MSFQRRSARALVIDVDEVIPFLRSVAYAVVAQRTTTLQWREETGVLASVYGNVFRGIFGTPGVAEVVSAQEAVVTRAVHVETHHFIDVLMARASGGPASVATYL